MASGIPRERPRLVDVAGRRKPFHHVGPAAEGREREAAAHDLPQDRQVRRDAEALLRTAARDAEARDHLVEDEQRARGVRQRAERVEEAGLGRDDAHVPGDRLDEDRGEALAVARDRLRCRLHVVVGADDRVLGRPRRHTRAGRDRQRREPRAGARQQCVGVPVVAAGELDDAVAAGEGTGEPDRAHRSLGPGRDQAHPLHGGNRLDDLLGQEHLPLGRSPERGAVPRRVDNRLDRLRVGVAEDQGPPREHPVEIAVAVLVLEVRALGATDEEGLVQADRLHRAHRGVDAAGDRPEGAAVEIGGGQSRLRHVAQRFMAKPAP